MKKILLLSCSLLAYSFLHAQSWMPHTTQRMKLADVVAAYKQQSLANGEVENTMNHEPGEGKDYLFLRWEWYMRQHCDAEGYMVSPMKNLLEWRAYMEQARKTNVAAKTTGGDPSNWSFQGPHQSNSGYSGMGRINVVAFDPIDSNIFYAGAAAGSTWKTTNGGASWVSLYDNWPTLGVSDIQINPKNRNTIYVATGDGIAGNAFSSGVIKSTDGGLNWSVTGLNWSPTNYLSASSLLINPKDTNTLVLASNNGIYKSYNGGQSWINMNQGVYNQILYNPADTNILYGSLTNYSNSTNQIMRSTDGGVTWDTVTHFPASEWVKLAVCTSSPNVVKAVVANYARGLQGIYASSDSGHTFRPVLVDTNCTNNILGYDVYLPTSSCGGQAYYDLAFAIDPNDSDKLTVGGISTFYSNDGGANWHISNQWFGWINNVSVVHSDKHCLAYNPLGGTLFETNDGGIYRTYDRAACAWTDLSNGLGITQFYRNAVDNGFDICLGGSQDNGSKMLNAGVCTDLWGADGMQCQINYGDPHHIWYVASQGGFIHMTRDSGVTFKTITDTLHCQGDWVAPYFLDPQDTATLYLAYKQVYVTHNNGISWTPISPVLDTSAYAYYLSHLAMANSNHNYMFTTSINDVSYNSNLYYTINGGLNWDTLSNPMNNVVSRIVIDPKNENNIWFTVSGYGPDKVYKYILNTNTWVNYSAGLPDMPVDCMVIDSSSGTRYIGTDAGVFYQKATDTAWALFMNHLPTVPVYDLNINYTTNEIWAATFGRGMWKSIKADTPQVNVLSVAALPPTADAINIFPDPNHGVFTIYTTSKELLGQKVFVILLTTDGKRALQKNMQFDNSGKLVVNAPNLRPGNYICEVRNKNMLTRSRVVIY